MKKSDHSRTKNTILKFLPNICLVKAESEFPLAFFLPVIPDEDEGGKMNRLLK